MNLLDTSTVLWSAREPSKLPRRVRELLQNPGTELFLSVISAWEIALKPALGISDAAGWISEAARRLQATVLPIRLEHISTLERLPPLHKDPFDRMLIAQSVSGRLQLITGDQAIRQYQEITCVWD